MSKSNGFKRSGRFRLAAAAVVSAGLLIPLAAFGATGIGQSSSAAEYQYKITICHHTHSKKHPMHTISVSVNAWPAHQKHGDTLGACPPPAKSKKANHGQSADHAQNGTAGQNGTQGKAKGHGK